MIISITQPIIETFSNIMTSVLLVHIMSFYPPFFWGANFFMDFKVKHPCHYMPIPCSTIRSKKSLGWTWTCPLLTSTWMRTPTSSAKRSNKMAVRLTPEDSQLEPENTPLKKEKSSLQPLYSGSIY